MDISSPLGLGRVSKKGIAPSSFGCSTANFMCGSMEFKCCNMVSHWPFGIMLKTSSTYPQTIAPHPVDEVAPPSQIPGLNLTQLNEIGIFRPNPHQFLDRQSNRGCRARDLQNWVICHKIQIPNTGQAL